MGLRRHTFSGNLKEITQLLKKFLKLYLIHTAQDHYVMYEGMILRQVNVWIIKTQKILMILSAS